MPQLEQVTGHAGRPARVVDVHIPRYKTKRLRPTITKGKPLNSSSTTPPLAELLSAEDETVDPADPLQDGLVGGIDVLLQRAVDSSTFRFRAAAASVIAVSRTGQ